MPSARSTAPSGTSGDVPPNAGQMAWWAHQSHSLDVRGRQSPVRAAPSMPAQMDRMRASKTRSSA